MSARKLDRSNAFKPVVVHSRQTSLSLSPEKIRIRKNGIEFYSPHKIEEYTEMSIEIESPKDGSKVRCDGVVVACTGNKHLGYNIAMLFTGVSSIAQTQLDHFARLTSH
ncbi:MAG: hypothetical protein ACP5T0_08355 [Verrucomicrobiia bacterium]